MGRHLPGRVHTFRPRGVCDCQDGTNAYPGAMQLLKNLIPSQQTAGVFIPRAASTQVTDGTGIPGVTTPGRITALLSVGTIYYGMIQDTNGTTDKPFVYDSAAATYRTITALGIFPTTQSNSGEWTPPTMTMMPSGRIIICHVGYPGTTGRNFGVLDVGSFSLSITADTHSTNTLDNLNGGSYNPITSGLEVGMPLSGTNIPTGAFVKSFTATTIVMNTNATGTTGGVTVTSTGGTPAAPIYACINTNGNALAAVPVGCGLMAGRANYLVNNTVVQSDSLHSSQVTNASQALTIGDNTPCTAIAQNSFTSQTQGGAIQSLIVFKGDETPFQITGDTATSNLSVNSLNAPAGTLAPNTICPTPAGLAYISQDGLRFIDQIGYIHPPVGTEGRGINNPFINVVNPSRMAAAFNSNVYRVSLTYKYFDSNNAAQTTTVEFWYHLAQAGQEGIWTGPHSFPADVITPSQAASNHGFIAAAHGVLAKLWQSDVQVTTDSTYTENGVALSWEYETVLLPDNEQMAVNKTVETSVMMAIAKEGTYSFTARDEQGNPLDTVSGSPAAWGTAIWNQSFWASVALAQTPIFWHLPLVYKQMSLDITGPSGASVAIGNVYLRAEELGYATQQYMVAPT